MDIRKHLRGKYGPLYEGFIIGSAFFIAIVVSNDGDWVGGLIVGSTYFVANLIWHWAVGWPK